MKRNTTIRLPKSLKERLRKRAEEMTRRVQRGSPDADEITVSDLIRSMIDQLPDMLTDEDVEVHKASRQRSRVTVRIGPAQSAVLGQCAQKWDVDMTSLMVCMIRRALDSD